MTESQFIEQNEADWKELEVLLRRNQKDAEQLHRLFVKVSSDLSYARTFYPNRSVRLYLNNLTQRVLDTMRIKEDKFSLRQIVNFFKHILPQEIYNSRHALLVSLGVFIIALSIGAISSAYNEDFPRLILGDDYINMTEDNIEKGDPMAVYKDERKLNMFFGITTNNIQVSFFAFVLGFFGSIGTIIVLLSNGIMIGAFQYFFYSKGLFWTSFLTIWIHGTIEISAIIIAGGAGIVLGSGLLFPKTYERTTSLQVSALRALRIILGVIPLFVMAGILESYVTRQTELLDAVKAGIIIVSLLFVLTMWVLYPLYYNYKLKQEAIDYTIIPQHNDRRHVDPISYRTTSQVIADAFLQFRILLGKNFKGIIIPGTLSLIPFLYVYVRFISEIDFSEFKYYSFTRFKDGGIFMFAIYVILASYCITILKMNMNDKNLSIQNILKYLKQYFLKIMASVLIVFTPLYFIPTPFNFISLAVLSPAFLVIMIENTTNENDSTIDRSMIKAFKLSFTSWLNYIVIYILIIGICILILLLSSSSLFNYLSNFVEWHHVFADARVSKIFVDHIIKWCLFLLCFPIVYYLLSNCYDAIRTRNEALDLKDRLKSFGQQSPLFE